MTIERKVPRWVAWILWPLVALIVVGALLRVGLTYLVRRGMSPAELAEMRRFFEEEFEFPAEWNDVSDWSPELVAACDGLMQAREDWAAALPGDLATTFALPLFQTRIFEVGALTEQELADLRDALSGAGPFLEEAARLAAIPDYDLEALRDRRKGADLPSDWFVDFNACRWARYAAAGSARLLAADGRWREAMGAALLSARLARRGEVSGFNAHANGVLFGFAAARTTLAITDKCDDPAALRSAMEAFAALEREAFRQAMGEGWDKAESASLLRGYKRKGYPVDLTGRHTRAHHMRQLFKAQVDYPKWRLSRVSPTSPEYKWLTRPAASGGPDPGEELLLWTNPWIRATGFARPFEEQFYRLWGPVKGQESMRRETAALALCRLARLTLARRLAEFDPADRDPILEVGLADPFDPSGAALRWSEDLRTYYSIGPDGADDKAKTVYVEMGWSPGAGDILAVERPAGAPVPAP